MFCQKVEAIISGEIRPEWGQEKVTVNQAIDQILQYLVQIVAAVKAIKVAQRNLRADVDSLIAQTGLPPKKGR